MQRLGSDTVSDLLLGSEGSGHWSERTNARAWATVGPGPREQRAPPRGGAGLPRAVASIPSSSMRALAGPALCCEQLVAPSHIELADFFSSKRHFESVTPIVPRVLAVALLT